MFYAGYCWCVNFKGEEIPGSAEIKPFEIDCAGFGKFVLLYLYIF